MISGQLKTACKIRVTCIVFKDVVRTAQ